MQKSKDAAKLALDERFGELLATNETVKKFNGFMEELAKATTAEDVVKLKGKFDEMGVLIKQLQDSSKGERAPMSFPDRIMKGVKEQWTAITSLKSNKAGNVILDLKASTMTENGSIIPIGSGLPFALTQYEPGVTNVVRRNPFIMQLVSVSRTVSQYMAWAEQTSTSPGAAANTSEGALKTQGSFTWTENSQKIEKITYFIKASKEILDDIPLMEASIRTELMDVLALRADQQILNGSGTTPQLKGILEYAQAFSPGAAFALNVHAANNLDVLRVAINQIETNGTNVGGELQGLFTPNYIVLHPSDKAALDLMKDSQARYLTPPFVDSMYAKVMGLPIVTNVGMPQGAFLIGDFTKSNVRVREDATISLGYENDDFTKNLVTILGECRMGHYVKSNHAKAFVYDTFNNARTQIFHST